MQSPPFSAIADVYDAIHQDVPHGAWLAFALSHVQARGVTPMRALDLGCGTGLLTELLVRHGIDTVGVDPAPAMLAVARRRLPGVTLLEGDACTTEVPGPFDLVLAVFDVVNYLLDDDDLRAFARNARRHLRPGGVLAFDANTTAGLRDPWGESVVEGWAGDVRHRFEHAWDDSTRRATLHTTFDTPQGTFEEVHVERPVDPDLIRSVLQGAGFTRIAVVTFPEGDAADDDDPRVWAFASAP